MILDTNGLIIPPIWWVQMGLENISAIGTFSGYSMLPVLYLYSQISNAALEMFHLLLLRPGRTDSVAKFGYSTLAIRAVHS